jgi:hypothetical protein
MNRDGAPQTKSQRIAYISTTALLQLNTRKDAVFKFTFDPDVGFRTSR